MPIACYDRVMREHRLGLPVVISSYQRPEKLLARYKEVTSWSRFDHMTITIDGLRKQANRNEFLNHKEVIAVAEDLALKDNRVDVLVWDVNTGVNDHAARLFARMHNVEGIILVEDDVGVNDTALDFLNDNLYQDGILATTAHVGKNHLKLEAHCPRASVFPHQWGLALNSIVMETYLEVIKSKKFERSVINRLFNQSLGSHLSKAQIQRLVQWWFNHFFFCERQKNWADAIIQYSVYANSGQYMVPARSLIFDDNSLNDPRSMHPRIDVALLPTCEEAELFGDDNLHSCISCEISSSRLEGVSVRNLIGATKHRKYLQVIERWV